MMSDTSAYDHDQNIHDSLNDLKETQDLLTSPQEIDKASAKYDTAIDILSHIESIDTLAPVEDYETISAIVSALDHQKALAIYHANGGENNRTFQEIQDVPKGSLGVLPLETLTVYSVMSRLHPHEDRSGSEGLQAFEAIEDEKVDPELNRILAEAQFHFPINSTEDWMLTDSDKEIIATVRDWAIEHVRYIREISISVRHIYADRLTKNMDDIINDEARSHFAAHGDDIHQAALKAIKLTRDIKRSSRG